MWIPGEDLWDDKRPEPCGSGHPVNPDVGGSRHQPGWVKKPVSTPRVQPRPVSPVRLITAHRSTRHVDSIDRLRGAGLEVAAKTPTPMVAVRVRGVLVSAGRTVGRLVPSRRGIVCDRHGRHLPSISPYADRRTSRYGNVTEQPLQLEQITQLGQARSVT